MDKNRKIPDTENFKEIFEFLVSCNEKERDIFMLGMQYSEAIIKSINNMSNVELATYMRELGHPNLNFEAHNIQKVNIDTHKWYQFWK
jgi:hypothetical protein